MKFNLGWLCLIVGSIFISQTVKAEQTVSAEESGVENQKYPHSGTSHKGITSEVGAFRAMRSESFRETPLQSSQASDLIAQGITRVTGVEVRQTAQGLELVLVTAAGSQRLVPLILPEGNDLVIDILDATLAFSIRNGVEKLNPAEGITKVRVNKIDDSSIRVRISGQTQAPSAEVVPGRSNLVLSINPQGNTARQAPDEEIEVIATGEAEEEGYNVPNASTATKTDTPLRDIPQSIQVVPQQVIEDRNIRSLTEAVETVSGVVDGGNLYGSSSGGRIIRGFQNDGNFRNGYRDVPNFYILSSPINTIEQIEVLKGPASVLFGDIEPGGIVNTVTKQPLSESLYKLEFEAGNRNFYQPSLDFSGPLTTDKDLLYRFIAAYQSKDGFQDFVESDQTTIAPSLTWKIGDKTNLNLYYEYTDFVADTPVSSGILLSDNSLTPRELFTSYPDFYDTEQSANRFGYTITHEFNDNWQIRNNFAGLIAKIDETPVYATAVEADRFATIEAYDLDYGYDNYFVQLDVVGKFKTGSVDHQVVVGFDFNDYTDDYIGFFNTDLPILDLQNPNYDVPEPIYQPFFEFENRVQSSGLYLQDQIALGKSFKLLIGGRYDWISSQLETIDLTGAGEPTDDSANDGAFSPRIGLVYQPSETISLYTSYSRSFRAQSGFGASPVGFDPTKGTQYEVGVKADWLDKKLSTTLAAYNLTKTNVLTTDPNNPSFSIQTGEQRSQGIELDVTGEILPGWDVTAAYAYTDAEVTEDETIPVGNRLQNVPENQASLWTTYTIQKGSLEGLGFGLGLFYVGERQADLDNSVQIEDYFRTDAALYYRRGRLNTAINIRNLFDTDYVSSTFGRLFNDRGEPFTITGSISWEF